MSQMQAAGAKALLVQADISIQDDVKKMFDEVLMNFGGVDVLINNAGFQIPSNSDDFSVDSFDRVIGTNLHSAFMAAQLAIKHFLAQNKTGVEEHLLARSKANGLGLQ